jgi:ABC-2 type transport system permease protein
MNKSLIIAKREYLAAVRTKGFLIALILLPVFMGGGLLVFTLLKDRTDVSDKKIIILDNSKVFKDYLLEITDLRNKNEIYNDRGEKILPAIYLEFVTSDTAGSNEQKLKLSNRIRNKDIHAFIEIGSDVVHPTPGEENSQIFYYAENASLDNIRGWFNNAINNKLRENRILELGIDPEEVKDLFYWVNVDGMGLLNKDLKTGEVIDARKSSELQTILVPYVLLLLMFMMVMMAALPLLTAVMEEKSERIAEVLLGSVTPTQFMIGKIIGSLAVSLTTSAIYIVGATVTLNSINLSDVIPFKVIPWFFVYMLLNITMIGSIMAALGATCNDSKDAQSMTFPAMLPIIIPLFVMMPIIMDPLSKMATILSLFPLWTPMLMLLRQSTSVTIPLWEPIAGLVGVVFFTTFCVWAGARIFRSTIILQGKRPRIGTIFRYIIKG